MDDAFMQSPLFAALDAEGAAALRASLAESHFSKGEVLFSEGEPGDRMYVIVDGKVKLGQTSGDGRESLLSILGPGEMFGELSLFDPGLRTSTATALTDAIVLGLGNEQLRPWLTGRPEVAAALLQALAQRLRRTNEDKRAAIKSALDDAELAKWSDNTIAKQCKVSNHLVAEVRRAWNSPSQPVRNYTKPSGKVVTMNTANVGKSKPAASFAVQAIDAKSLQAAPVRPAKVEAPEPPAEDFGPSEEEITGSRDAINSDMVFLQMLIGSDDKLQAAVNEVKKLNKEVEILTHSRNALQAEVATLKGQIKNQKR